MKRLFFLLTLILAVPLLSNSCLNIEDIDKYLKQNRFDCFPDSKDLSNRNRMIYSGILLPFKELEYDRKSDLKSQNKLAAFQIYLGSHYYNEARKTLEKLIKEYPNDYSVNANLGTLYELLGQNELALKHIRKAIAIDPASHENSEWIHVKILEAKIKFKNEKSKYVDILGISFGKDSLPAVMRTVNFKEVRKQLLYQLAERSYFITGPDPIMADLIFLSADLAFHTGDFKCAHASYKTAKEYGFVDAALVDKRISASNRVLRVQYPDEYSNDTLKKEQTKPTPKSKNKKVVPENKKSKFFPLFFSPLLIILIIIIARKRRKNRNN